MAVLQQFAVSPLILKGEVYEAASAASLPAKEAGTTHAHGATGAHDHDGGWKPREGLERIAITSLATIAASTGYALLLLAAMLLSGSEIGASQALAFAACGFIATGLAPAMGLPPDLPGSAAGPLAARQIWWILTAVATAAALWLLLALKRPGAKLAGLVLLALPHVIGAPQPAALESKAPAELAAQFVAVSLGLQALLWASIGFAVAAIWPLFEQNAAMERQPFERAKP